MFSLSPFLYFPRMHGIRQAAVSRQPVEGRIIRNSELRISLDHVFFEIKKCIFIGDLLLSCPFVSGYYSFGGTWLVSAANYFRRKGPGAMLLVGVEGAKPLPRSLSQPFTTD